MLYSKNNVIHGTPLPKYMLDNKSNLSQFFIRSLGENGNKTLLVC